MNNVTKLPTETERVLMDLACGETALPAHLMLRLSEHIANQGFQFRADIYEKLNRGTEAALAPLPGIRMLNVAKRVDGMTETMIRDLDGSNPVEGFVIASRFALLLVEEGYLADVDNMAVLVAMVVMEELREYGQFYEYRYDEARVKLRSQGLLTKAILMGYYQQRLDQKAQISHEAPKKAG